MKYKLPKFSELYFSKSGQATLLAILVISAVAVVTAVGVATRQNIGVRRTTYTSQTDQAFGCANSGVDAAMLCIRLRESGEQSGDPVNCDVTTPLTLSEDNGGSEICNYSYTVENLFPEGDSRSLPIPKLPKDSVQQFTTTGSDYLDITFSKFTESSLDVGLEVTVAYEQSSGDTGVDKFLWYCGTSLPQGTEGFDFITPNNGSCTGRATIPNDSGIETIVRLRPYFGPATLTVSNLPNISQGYLITSSGVSGSVQRNIEVMRMNPQLPAIFDYVLYSEEGSITK